MKKIFLLLIAAFVLFFLWYRWGTGAPGEAATTATVTVEKGMGVTAIAAKLDEAGMIRSPRAFSLYNRWHGTQTLLKAGAYKLDASMSASQIVALMTDGDSQQTRVTIPEGFTVKDIDALLVRENLIQPGAFVECAQRCDVSAFAFLPSRTDLAARGGKVEGYLYPDTYFVSPAEFEPKAFLERLLTEFNTRVVTALKDDIAASGHSLHDAVTMASLVEEEAKGEEQRKVVAGILWSRIEQGIGLYVDATTRYIVEKPTAALTTTDLAVNSPYNTRQNGGLPPGPIASPSIQSIQATLHPTDSPYLYYLHGTDGKIRYAETNDEHNRNKQLYLR